MNRITRDDSSTRRFYRTNGSNTNSNNSIELTAEVDELIDNKAYRPRYRKLMREYPSELTALAKYARSQARPSRFFAKCCAVANWERTLRFIAKIAKVRRMAERVARKLQTDVTRFIYKQVWAGVNVERWADTAAEVGRDKTKYFAWLCRQEVMVRAT
jgi:hypothetical protein